MKKYVLSVESIQLNTKTKHIGDERFKSLLASEFEIEQWAAKLNKWWTLDYSSFIGALKVKLTLAQKDELLSVFDKYSTELIALDNEIQETEKEIDQLVYELYDLTKEEVAIVEGK